MQNNGYVIISHNNYLAWKNSVLNNGYDADGLYGDQCWDLTAEFWYNLGFPANYPLTGGEDAKGVWTQRFNNISYNETVYFDLITDYTKIKQGDVIVFNENVGGGTGHIGFADEDYNGTMYIRMLGQNQGNGYPYYGGGQYTSLQTYTLANFSGAFRYLAWQPTPPHPVTHTKRSKFPWVLYANKIRNRQI